MQLTWKMNLMFTRKKLKMNKYDARFRNMILVFIGIPILNFKF